MRLALLKGLGSLRGLGLLRGGAVLALAAAFVAGSLVLPMPLAAQPASAAPPLVDCSMLAVGQPCVFDYAEHPEARVQIPGSVAEVTVVLNGASGGGGYVGTGAAGLGGSVVAVLDTTTADQRDLSIWLGQAGDGHLEGTEGWAKGGRAGQHWPEFNYAGSSGAAGGGASGLALTSAGHDAPLLVAGGGGGGGGSSSEQVRDGGLGGSGGDPGQNGTSGLSPKNLPSGAGGHGGSEHNGTEHHGTHGINARGPVGSGGGGGGGGWFGGHGGGDSELEYKHDAGAGGGGGGGSSYIATSGVAEHYGLGLAPFGNGSVAIYPSAPLEPFECIDSTEGQPFAVPSDIGAYAFVAMGGAGEHGHNEVPEGTGGFVTGVLDVHDIHEFYYWVGCSGYSHDGAGYGLPGAGGKAEGAGNDGGRGGGATAIALDPAGVHVLVAAGGGGGSGGDVGTCSDAPGPYCGGAGGSSAGSSHSRFPAHGKPGGNDYFADGGAGGCASCHHHDGELNRNGGEGVSPPDTERTTGAGGGGGAGYPAGGAGGHHNPLAAGGGGGAGGSYLSSRVSAGGMTASGHFGSGYLLLIPIKKADSDLSVTVTATGPAAAYAVAPFTIHAACELAGTTILDRTFTLRAGETRDFTDLQAGAVCTITETGTGGATTPPAAQVVTLGAAPALVGLENVFAAGDLALSVQSAMVDAVGDPVTGVQVALGDLHLSAECSVDGHPLALPSGGHFVVPGEATWAGWTDSIDGLPVGAACAIEETANGRATTVVYAADGGPWEPLPGETLIAAGGSSLGALNRFEVGSFTVSKAATGTAPPDAEYGMTYACTFGGLPVTISDPVDISLAVDASIVVSPVPVGADCTVTETDAGIAQATTYSPSRTVRITTAGPAVEVTNHFVTGKLVIEVTRTGDGSHWASGGYTVHVSCTDGTETDVPFPSGGGVATLDTIDDDAVCDVTEPDAAGATSVAFSTSGIPSPVPGHAFTVIPPTGSASVQIVNTFDAAPLDLTVALTGAGTRFGDGAIVAVQNCSFDGVEFAPGPDGPLVIAFPYQGGHSTTPPMPVGAVCDVHLSDNGGGRASFAITNGAPSSLPVEGVTARVTVNDETTEPTTVAITLDYPVAALVVDVENEGDAAAYANAPFEVRVHCALDSDPVHGFGTAGVVFLHFTPDGTLIPDPDSAQLAELPVGAACEATETVTGGATEWGTNPPGTTIEADGASMLVTNVFDATPLTVRAFIGGNDAVNHPDAQFVFDLECRFNGVLLPTSLVPPTVTIEPDGTYTQSVPDGTTCTVTEIHDEHATSVTPSRSQSATLPGELASFDFTNTFDVETVTVTQGVGGDGAATYGDGVGYLVALYCIYAIDDERIQLPGDNRVLLDEGNAFTATVDVPSGATCGAQEPYGLASRMTFPEPIVVAPGGGLELELQAFYDLGTLSVQKDARGQFAASLAFGFDTTCTFDTGRDIVEVPLNAHADPTYELGDGEAIMLTALHGSTCTTIETQAHDPLRVAAEASGVEASVSGASASVAVVRDIPASVLVVNFFVGSLPLTGSELSLAGLWIGLVLLVVGAVVVTVRIRAQRNPIPSRR